ncbi:hypothetical protein RRSWK_04714 [Rhodopirellula sp. SWK7]|nr:hypothetical protein RRSWK_04714 [Rhodopirellula sp. SWK7]
MSATAGLIDIVLGKGFARVSVREDVFKLSNTVTDTFGSVSQVVVS